MCGCHLTGKQHSKPNYAVTLILMQNSFRRLLMIFSKLNVQQWWQHATISGTSCRRRWPARSESSAVSKYQSPSRGAHQAVYCWQPCLSGCSSWSLEQSAIVIIADFLPSIKNSSFSIFHTLTWLFDHLTGIVRVSGPCSNVHYLGHSKNLCLLTYLFTYLQWKCIEYSSLCNCVSIWWTQISCTKLTWVEFSKLKCTWYFVECWL